MTVYHFVFENNNLYICICLFIFHCQKNTYCTLYYYCYRKILIVLYIIIVFEKLYTYMNAEEKKRKSNQIKYPQQQEGTYIMGYSRAVLVVTVKSFSTKMAVVLMMPLIQIFSFVWNLTIYYHPEYIPYPFRNEPLSSIGLFLK